MSFTRLILMVFLLSTCLCACRSEGHKMVDRLADTLEETARIMARDGAAEARSLEALDYLEERAVAMRMAQSKLDDVVRTLNEGQRRDLAEYTTRRLQRVKEILK